VASVLALLKEMIKPGITTLELNNIAEKETAKYKAMPAFKGYSGYPYSLCCSLNSQVVHGMPSSRPLVDADIISIDFGVRYRGFYGDAAITVPVGTVSEEALDLIRVTEESLFRGIAVATDHNRLSDISHAIQSYVEAYGYSVVRDFVGHGIGRQLHEDPQIPNYGLPGKGVHLKPGMVLAIEPMINQGGHAVRVMDDGWTAVTIDGKLSAHFEHTVAITDNGPEILTAIA
jgi:methionyl aminopeptidase